MTSSIHELEEVTFRAWPAEEIAEVSGWRLRFTHGVTRRGNSVWTGAADGAASVAERVDAVEAFYEAHRAPSVFQLTPATEPSGLDAALDARGYAIDGPTVVQTVALDQFRITGQPPQIATRVTTTLDPEWFELATTRGRFAGAEGPYRGILDRMGKRAGFALAHWKGKPIAIGLGVLDGPWLGIFGMSTAPEARRRRAATAILGALAAWGSARGASRAYLQVERDNESAKAMYSASGFTTAYEYWYRVLRRPENDADAAPDGESTLIPSLIPSAPRGRTPGRG